MILQHVAHEDVTEYVFGQLLFSVKRYIVQHRAFAVPAHALDEVAADILLVPFVPELAVVPPGQPERVLQKLPVVRLRVLVPVDVLVNRRLCRNCHGVFFSFFPLHQDVIFTFERLPAREVREPGLRPGEQLHAVPRHLRRPRAELLQVPSGLRVHPVPGLLRLQAALHRAEEQPHLRYFRRHLLRRLRRLSVVQRRRVLARQQAPPPRPGGRPGGRRRAVRNPSLHRGREDGPRVRVLAVRRARVGRAVHEEDEVPVEEVRPDALALVLARFDVYEFPRAVDLAAELGVVGAGVEELEGELELWLFRSRN